MSAPATFGTPQQAWVAQFKTLLPEEQKAIIATKATIDIFSEKHVKGFYKEIKPAMEILAQTESATSALFLEHCIESSASLTTKSGLSAPVLPPKKVEALYVNFMNIALKHVEDATWRFEMELGLEQAVSCAKKANVAAPGPSPEKIQSLYVRFMDSAIKDAEDALSEPTLRACPGEAEFCAQKAGVPAPGLAPEKVKAKIRPIHAPSSGRP